MYLRFVLIDIGDDGFYHYEIYPENKEEHKQTLVFNPETKDIRVNTFDDASMKYLGKFLQNFKNQDGTYRKELSFGWG
ncbi:TPA: hypothetical protein TZ831_000228 [Streptococcus suis]|nr:hypothetical protein [Streptococcus suis]